MVMLCYVMLCYVMLCYVCYVMLYYVSAVFCIQIGVFFCSQVIDAARLCVDGESLVESPSWKSSNVQGNPYTPIEEEDTTDVVKLTMCE